MAEQGLWIEVFKAGSHTDSSGNTRDWSISDIDTIVKMYNTQPQVSRHEAPVVIGHPVDDSPAYGWVAELKREGSRLLAYIKDLAPEFVEWVRKGLYKKRSISLYSDMLLKHVGFLGGVPPAVKGMVDPQFKSDIGAILIEVTDYSEDNNKININNKLDKRSNIMTEETFNLLLSDLITWLSETFGDEVANQTNGYLDSNRAKYLQAVISPTDQDQDQDQEQDQEYQESARIKELELQVAELRKQNRDKDFRQYLEKLVKEEGKLMPKQIDYAMALLELGYNAGRHQFTEQGVVKEGDAIVTVKKFLESYEKKVDISQIPEGRDTRHNYTEFGGLKIDEERMRLDNEIQNYISEQLKQGKIVNYLDALNIVINKIKE